MINIIKMEQSGLIYLTSDLANTFDPNYRYKVQALQCESIKRSGRDLTRLVNLESFAKSIDLDNPIPLIKILGKILSCESKSSPDYVLVGKYTPKQINEIMCKFIQEIILCSKCGFPELELKAKKDKGIKRKCKSCGKSEYIKPSQTNQVFLEILEKNI